MELDRSPENSVRTLETIRQTIQNNTNQIILIESVQGRRILASNSILDYDNTKSDITFVVVVRQGYSLMENAESSLWVIFTFHVVNFTFSTLSNFNGLFQLLFRIKLKQSVRLKGLNLVFYQHR